MELAKFLLFTVVSSIEYIAILALSFGIFRINFSWYKPQIAFVCISLSYVSFTLREDSLALYAPFVQMVVLSVLMWLLFRFQIFYAIILAVTGYLAFGLLQGTMIFITSFFVESRVLLSIQMNVISLLCGLLSVLIYRFIRKRNLGFSFVPHNEDIAVKYHQKENMLMILVLTLSIVSVAISYSFTILFDTSLAFFLTIIILFLSMSFLIYIAHYKDRKDGYYG